MNPSKLGKIAILAAAISPVLSSTETPEAASPQVTDTIENTRNAAAEQTPDFGIKSAEKSLSEEILKAGFGIDELIILLLLALYGNSKYQKWRRKRAALGRSTSMATRREEMGDLILPRELPSLQSVLSEVVPDAAAAIAALGPDSTQRLNRLVATARSIFENSLAFHDKAEGHEMFQVPIKLEYLDCRIREIDTQLAPAEVVGEDLTQEEVETLEAELQRLVASEQAILNDLVEMSLPVASITKSRKKAIPNVVATFVRRGGGNSKDAKAATVKAVNIPERFVIGEAGRDVRELQLKRAFIDAKYPSSLLDEEIEQNIVVNNRATGISDIRAQIDARISQAYDDRILGGARRLYDEQVDSRLPSSKMGRRAALIAGAAALITVYGYLSDDESPTNDGHETPEELDKRLNDESRNEVLDKTQESLDQIDRLIKEGSKKDRPNNPIK